MVNIFDLLNELVEGGIKDAPFCVESNFGTTQFLGVGQAPRKVLSYTDNLLQRFVPETWREQSTQIIRAEVKLCPDAVHLIEIEQRPCGLGVFMEACKQHTVSPDIGIDLSKVTVLHSPGRMKEGVFFSDEHLFTEHIFPWEERREIPESLVIRSREDEEIPGWLDEVFRTQPLQMFLLRRNADKAEVYNNLDLPHSVFPELTDLAMTFPAHVKQILLYALRDFKRLRCVLKPRRGSRAREVITLGPSEIAEINRRSQFVRNLRKNPNAYVLQPYYRGVCEVATSRCHLYRLFYVRTESHWRYIGGFLALDDVRRSKMIVHGPEEIKNILIIP